MLAIEVEVEVERESVGCAPQFAGDAVVGVFPPALAKEMLRTCAEQRPDTVEQVGRLSGLLARYVDLRRRAEDWLDWRWGALANYYYGGGSPQLPHTVARKTAAKVIRLRW